MSMISTCRRILSGRNPENTVILQRRNPLSHRLWVLGRVYRVSVECVHWKRSQRCAGMRIHSASHWNGRGDVLMRPSGNTGYITMSGELPTRSRKHLERYWFASYLLGHVDGLGLAIDDVAPKALHVIASHPYFESFFPRLYGSRVTQHIPRLEITRRV
jgi:hypothetical protein